MSSISRSLERGSVELLHGGRHKCSLGHNALGVLLACSHVGDDERLEDEDALERDLTWKEIQVVLGRNQSWRRTQVVPRCNQS